MADKIDKSKGASGSHNPARGPILVPIDFSSYSEAALLLACEFAEALGLKLVVLHVVHDPHNMPGYYAKMATKKTLTRMSDIAAEMLDEFLAGVQKRHPERAVLQAAEVLLVKGIPATRILQVVEKVKASMVVMGSKGETGIRHLLLGSVAEQVLGLAKLPVTIVKDHSKH